MLTLAGTWRVEQGRFDVADDLLSNLVAIAGLAGDHCLSVLKGDEHVSCNLPLLLLVLTRGLLDQFPHDRSSTLLALIGSRERDEHNSCHATATQLVTLS